MSLSTSIPDLRNELFYKALVRLPYIEAIYVYGSYSTGRATEHSDVDLAIECPEATEEEWQHIKQTVENTPCLLKIDLQRMDRMPHNDFYKRFINTRSLLFMRSPGDNIDFVLEAWERVITRLPFLKQKMQQPSFSAEDIKQISSDFYNVFRLCVRLMRRALLVHDIRTVGRVSTLRYALQKGWITERKTWEQMYMAWMIIQKNPQPPVLAEILTKMPLYVTHLESATNNIKQFYEEEKRAIANGEFSPHSSEENNYA